MDVTFMQLDQQTSAFPGISSLAHPHFQTPVAPGVGVGATSGPESPFQLPENWIKHWSEKKKEYYYFNIRTKESRWTPPEKKADQPRSVLKRSTEELSTPSSSSPKRRVYTPPPITPPPSPAQTLTMSSPLPLPLSSPLLSPLPSPITSPLLSHSSNGVVGEYSPKKTTQMTTPPPFPINSYSSTTTPILLTSGQRARETLQTAERILQAHHPYSFGQKFDWEDKEDTPEQAVSRRSEVQRLQGLLRNLSRGQGLSQEPAGSFQRWSFVQLLVGPALDPLIPSVAEEDSGLLQELTSSGLSAAKAKEIATKLAEAATASAKQLNEARNSPSPSQEEEVAVVPYWDQIRVQWNRTALYLNRKHYERLQALYSKHCGEMDKFKRRLFSLLTRYEALGGPGYQAATPAPVLEALKEKLGLSHECFASPLNCRLSSYGSAFYDTDRFFGSSGSFFHSFSPSSGSFQANPPFVEEVMMAMALKLIQLLERSEDNGEPMSFVVIVPGWRDTPSYLSLSSSRFLRKEIQLEKYQHAYHDGFQHRSAKNYRVADCVTIVFFLQNLKGAEKWPVTDDLILSVRNGFASHDSNANL